VIGTRSRVPFLFWRELSCLTLRISRYMKRHIGIATALLLSFALLLTLLFYRRSPQPDPSLEKVLHAHVARRLSLPERAWTVAFSPDSRLLLTAGVSPATQIWNVNDSTWVRALDHPQGLTWGAFSHDGTLIATASYDQLVRIWRVADGALLQTLHGHSAVPWTVAFSPDDRTLASGGADHNIILWDVITGAQQRTLIGHTQIVWAVTFSPDGKTLASTSFDHSIRLWSLAGGEPRILNGHTQAVVDATFTPDGSTLVSCGDDERVRVWRVADGTEIRSMGTSPHHQYAIAVSPDGKYVASGGRDHGPLGEVVQNFFGARSAGRGPTLFLWRIEDGALLQALDAHENDVHGVAFSPDGKWMASASEDRSAIVWRIGD
jgi:WD40 repeat protein